MTAFDVDATPHVTPVRGGKVHLGTASLAAALPFPLCRTGSQTNQGTRYRVAEQPVTCKTCLMYQQREE